MANDSVSMQAQVRNKPIYIIETKGMKSMSKTFKNIQEDFIEDRRSKIVRNVAAKLKAKLQLGFMDSRVSTEIIGQDIKITIDNFAQLNGATNGKAINNIEKLIEDLYQEEFAKTKVIEGSDK